MGVAHAFYQVGGFSWAALLVALGFPLYFIVRRAAGTNTIAGLWFDMLLTLPVAVLFIVAAGDLSAGLSHRPVLMVLIPLLGLISAAAVACYILASHRLKLGAFRTARLCRTGVAGVRCAAAWGTHRGRRMDDIGHL